MDYEAEALRHRKMAEEFRTMADCTPQDSLRVHYRKLARTYDQLAEDEVRVARNMKLSS